jgi:hypothetical protein
MEPSAMPPPGPLGAGAGLAQAARAAAQQKAEKVLSVRMVFIL